MIPLRDIIPSRTTPYVTVSIIAANLLVFGYQLTLPPRATIAFVYTWSLVPADLSLPTLVSSMFLHGGWLHLLGNMLYLWIFGDNVEDRVGHARFLVFYLGCGILAGLAHLATNPMSLVPTVGASGAIAGVMGAYFVLYPRSRILTLIPIFIFFEIIEVPAILFLGFWFLLQLLNGVGTFGMADAASGGIAFWAHISGFVAGAALIFVFRRPERVGPEWWSQ
jgi:membrane associated rhomboid family serine protease